MLLLNGIKFGLLLLQLAIGPVCLYIFQVAVNHGPEIALRGVGGVTLVDSAFILLAIYGVGRVLDSSVRIKKVLMAFGAMVLVLFGANCISSVWGVSLLPNFNLAAPNETNGVFVYAVLLTASNPLTIVFWTGLFSTKVIEENLSKGKLFLFSLGCIIASFTFLTLITLAAGAISLLMTPSVVGALNIGVGLVLIGLGVKKLFSLALKK